MSRADQPRPPLETVTDHADIGDFGIPVSVDDIEITRTVEREFLTALVWAPPSLAASVVRALIGPDRLSLDAPLLYLPGHGAVFALIAGSVHAGAPLRPVDLGPHAADPAAAPAFRNLLMEIASPNPAGPWPLPVDSDLPALAASVVDQWHRRGYQALLERMSTVLIEEPSDTLGAHWAALSAHQRTAEQTRRTILTALADIG
ncbi:hypothetical protein [Gordonia hirsuta]|nr:hypothetical protein [Gordonia hirsuta]